MSGLKLYSIWHLNLAYSSIGEDQRQQVLSRSYWPLLKLIETARVPMAIEATGMTLEMIAALDPTWICHLKSMMEQGVVLFVASGHAQIIGPLVDPIVNEKNLQLGLADYQRILGVTPRYALINEQAYSSGLLQHYCRTGFRAVIMEWENPLSYGQYVEEAHYGAPMRVQGVSDTLPVIWNSSIAFQKFQRYVHGDLSLDDYIHYMDGHENNAYALLYGNDAEIFGYRPGRYHTEADLGDEDEWHRISQLLASLKRKSGVDFVAIDSLPLPAEDAPTLVLQSAVAPVPVKKQAKYNVSRWGVTGRDDFEINTTCALLASHFEKEQVDEDQWRQLCELWSSDYRTHIEATRWEEYRQRLDALCRRHNVAAQLPNMKLSGDETPHCPFAVVEQRHHLLWIETRALVLVLNVRRGMAIESYTNKLHSHKPVVGTLPHGYYSHISLGADYYSCHLVFESPGAPKVTDLQTVKPVFTGDGQQLAISGRIETPLGSMIKTYTLNNDNATLAVTYQFDFESMPAGSLRLGYITLMPEAFDGESLFFETQNGGFQRERFEVAGADVHHGSPVSFLVSAQNALGVTDGKMRVGDANKSLRVQFDRSQGALLGMMEHRRVNDTYFYRLCFSAQEMDETSRFGDTTRQLKRTITFQIDMDEGSIIDGTTELQREV